MRVPVVTVVCVVMALGCASLRDQPSATAVRDDQKQAPAQPFEAGGLQSGELFDALVQMDRALFEASFETCDAAKANSIFADDVEFYHDQTGLAVGEQVRENTRRLGPAVGARAQGRRPLRP